MKSYLGIIPLSAKNRKKQNQLTLTCIVISVFLVTGIFSMVDAVVWGDRIRTLNKHGDWHFSINNVSEDILNDIAQEDCIDGYSRYDSVNEDLDEEYYINGKRVVLCCCDEDYTEMNLNFDKNSYPRKSEEIVLNSSMRSILGINKGDTVVLMTPKGEHEMVVSGFINDDSLDLYDAAGAFVTVESFRDIIGPNGSSDGLIGCYKVKNDYAAGQNMEEIKAKYRILDSSMNGNTMLLALYGNSGNSYVTGLYIIAVLLLIFVIAAGVFMIAGSISANVSERTSFFGVLRCIGASKRQILNIVSLEALYWCKTAVPIGIALGTLGTWGLIAILSNISEEFTELPTCHISPIGIAVGIVSGVLTVYLAAVKPACNAAKVSPMAAVTGNRIKTGRDIRIKNLESGVEYKLGRKFAFAHKDSMFMISGSFALSIIILFMFVSILQLVHVGLPCLRDYSADIELYVNDYGAMFNKETLAQLKDLKEVKNAFGRMYAQIPATSNVGVDVVDLISYDELQFKWAENDCEEGDVTKALKNDGYLVTVFDKSNPLQVGDKLTIKGQTMEVAAVLNNSPFSSSDIPTVICSESTFEGLFGESNYSVISLQIKPEYEDFNQQKVRNIIGDSVVLSDRRQTNRETKATWLAFNMVVYSFIIMVALISVINIINSLAMSTQARMKQYGIMRAIGLDNEGLFKIILTQGATYAGLGIILGTAVGIPLHYLSYTILVTNHFGIAWSLPVSALISIVIVIMSAAGIAVIKPIRKIESVPVTGVLGEL